MVLCKGDQEDYFVASLVVADVAWLGHSRLILKEDKELVLQAFVRQSLELVRVICEAVESVSQ